MTPETLDQIKQCCRDEASFERVMQLITTSSEHPAISDVLDTAPTVDHYKVLSRSVARIRESLDMPTIFKTAAHEVRNLLSADRVGVFQFYPGTGFDLGEFVSEDVDPAYPSAIAIPVEDHCFGEQHAVHYQSGHVQAVSDIYAAGLQDCHISILAQFHIKANLVVPIRVGDALWGLFCIHQCVVPRQWQEWEIEFVKQIAEHMGIALRQAELFEQTRLQSQELAQALEELQLTQMQLTHTEKMSSLGQLVAGVAHEINNPVNFIYGNLVYVDGYTQDLLTLMQLYQQYYPEPIPDIENLAEDIELEFLLEDLPKTMHSMRVGAERIREIVLSLRNFARSDEAEMKCVDIHEGIESTLLILQHRFKRTPCRPEIHVAKAYSAMPSVECYAGQLNQVFMNILANAIEAFEDDTTPTAWDAANPPTITIQTQCIHDQQVQISIKDNGPGIPPEVQRRLFDPFYTTKPVGKGTGLGLSISHQIVTEWHQGTLKCISSPGQGTEFQVTIPIHQG